MAFLPHAALLAVSTFFEHEKLLEYALTASFHYSIQNLRDNSLITDSLQENCPSYKSKELNRGRAQFSQDESAGGVDD